MERCFDVGVNLCGDKQEYMVDDLQGIGVNLIHSLREDEMEQFSDFFKSLKDSSYKRFLKDLELKFTKEKSFNHIVAQSKPYGNKRLNIPILSKDILGYRVHLPFHEFTEYDLKSISLYGIQRGRIRLHIIDLLSGDNYYICDYDTKKGKNTIKVDKQINSSDSTLIFIGIEVLEGSVMALECDEIADCCGCNCVEECDISLGKLEPCGVYNCEAIETYKYRAFCPNDAVTCNFEKMVCEYAEFFQEAYMYRVALDILDDKINSYQRGWYSDANVTTVIDYTKPEIKEMYYKLIHLAITNIRGITNDSICWSCDAVSGGKPFISSYA